MEKKTPSAAADTPAAVAPVQSTSKEAPASTVSPSNGSTQSPSNGSSPANAAPTPAAPPVETIQVQGVLDIDLQRGGNGQLLDLAKGGKRRPSDPFVPKELIRRFKLRTGSMVI